MGPSKSFARLSVRLPVELKQVIEQHERTELNQRDWDAFVRLLDDENAKPNRALTQAAREYRMSRGWGDR